MHDPRVGRFFAVDPLAAKFAAWSSYNFCLGNPIRFVDPDGRAPQDWIKNKKTGKFTWDSKVTSKENTPKGYKYIGKNNIGICNNLFGTGNYQSKTWDVGLMGFDDDDGGVGFYNGRVDTKMKVSFLPQVETTIDDEGNLNKEFLGVEAFVTIVSNMSAAIPGGNPDYILSDIDVTLNGKKMTQYKPKGHFITEVGNLPSVHFTRSINANTIQANYGKSYNYYIKLNGLYADDNGKFLGNLGSFGLLGPNRTNIDMLIKFTNK